MSEIRPDENGMVTVHFSLVPTVLRAEIVGAWDTGASQTEIAKTFCVSISVVRGHLLGAGIKPVARARRGPKPNSENPIVIQRREVARLRIEYVCAELLAGRTGKSIADEMEISRERVRQIAKKGSVVIRTLMASRRREIKAVRAVELKQAATQRDARRKAEFAKKAAP